MPALRSTVLIALSLLPLAALAQSGERHGGSFASGAENVSYGYAQVTRVDPVYETVRTIVPEERCDVPPGRAADPTGGTVVGALVGAALGNQVGKGDGRDAATVAGAVIGGAIGRNVARNEAALHPGCRIVEVEREQRRVAGYDVEYVHQGRTFMSRMPYDPGDRVRLRISVQPVAEAGFR
ncbi:MAG: glycine zipper 2TM domain-containing protein [Xanthomonadaceae bacterium]|nr:glycine zipper 2TM domain-containing protein [Xanthomonadaceae bacterium]